MSDKDLTVWLRLRDDATSQLRKILPSLKRIGAAIGLAAAAGVALSVKSFIDFKTALNNVQAVSQATGAEMERFKQQALDMGAATKFSAQEAAEAQSFLAMAGLSVQQSLDALPGTLQLAAAGNLDLARATDIATDVMSGYRLGVSDLGRINDVIATTAASANTNVEQVGAAMVYVGPVAAAAGLAIETTSAAIGLLANAGFKGEMGGTALRGAIAKLLNPSSEAKDILGDLGVTVLDSTGKMRPFATILDELQKGGMAAGDAMKIFGQRAGPGMLALVSQGGDALRDLTGRMEDSTGAAQRMADVQQQGIVGSWTQMLSAASNLAIMLGDKLGPATAYVFALITDGLRWLSKGSDETSRWSLALSNLQVILGVVWSVLKPVVSIVADGLSAALSLATVLIKGMVDNFNTLINNLQVGYNWIARLVPGMNEVATATEKASEAGYTWSDYLNGVGAELPIVSAGLAGGPVGASLAPSAEVATLSLSELSLVTDIQWAKYQKLWQIGTPVTDVLVSHNREFGKLAGVTPGVVSGLAGVSLAIGATGGAAKTFIDTLSTTITADKITGIFTAAFTGGGGVLGALKAIGTQLAGALSNSFLAPLTSALSAGLKGIFSGGGAAAGGAAAGGAGAAAGGAGAAAGLGSVLASVPVYGWIALGGLAAFMFFKGFGGPDKAELAGREVADGFRRGILSGLTPAQYAEVDAAVASGTHSWTGAALHIAIRDAKLASGATIEEAERAATGMVAMLHRAEKEGPEAVARAQAEIQKILDEGKKATDELTTSVVADADEIADRFANMSAKEIAELRAALRSLKPVAVDTFRGIRSSSLGAGVALQRFLVQILAVNAAIAAMPRDVTLRVNRIDTGAPAGIGRRQHGGPVSAGVPYRVGEAGEEIFIPGRSGSVASNKSIPSAEEIGEAVARSMRRSPLVVPRDAVTDTVIGNSQSRRALAGFN